MKKDEIIQFLKDRHIDVTDLTYQEMLPIYHKQVKLEKHTPINNIDTAPITNVTTEEVTNVNNDINVNNDTYVKKEISMQEIFDELDSIDDKQTNIFDKENSVKKNLIIKICKFFPQIKGKVRGTPEELHELFSLYNAYYKRSDSPSCSTCISNVYTSIYNIYKKYNQYV